MSAAVDLLLELGTPAELRRVGDSLSPDDAVVAANTHVHLPPNFSAFDSVSDALAAAASEGLNVLGASNYYDYRVYERFAAEAGHYGVMPLYGLEIVAVEDDLRDAGVRVNDPGNPGKFYVCGKGTLGFARPAPEAELTLQVVRQRDTERIDQIVKRLNEVFEQVGVSLHIERDTVVGSVVRRHQVFRDSVFLQERHVAQVFQEALFVRVPFSDRLEVLRAVTQGRARATDPVDATAIQNDIRSLMKEGRPAFVPDTPLGLSLAVDLVRGMDGIPCYPLLADGAPHISAFEFDPARLAERVREYGIQAVEVIPPRNAASVLNDFVATLRRTGLIVTAGTEHNTLERGPLRPRTRSGSVPDAVERIFQEGAAVLIAHQFLVAHGESGYLDEGGEPSPSNADVRIAAFERLGRAVLSRFLERYGQAKGWP